MGRYYLLSNKQFIGDKEYEELIDAILDALEELYARNIEVVEVKDMYATCIESYTLCKFIPNNGEIVYVANKFTGKIEHFTYSENSPCMTNIVNEGRCFKSHIEARFNHDWNIRVQKALKRFNTK